MASKLFVLRFKFDDFENLPHAPGDETLSNEATDENGDDWQLVIYPGGKEESDNDEAVPMISLYLWSGWRGATAKISFIVRDSVGGIYRYKAFDKINTYPMINAYGGKNIWKRSEILDKSNKVLLDGTLIVDVEIQIVTADESFFQPVNPLAKNMLKPLENDDDADLSFKLGDTLVSAHRLILKVNAPVLYEFCQRIGKDTPVAIDNTDPEVFRLVLRYVYAGEATEAIELLKIGWIYDGEDVGEYRAKIGKELIEAADRFGIVGLKMIVETALVKRYVITLDTAVDWLLFADAKNCPLLKEYAMNYFISMVKDAFKSNASDKLKESPKLLAELVLAMSNNPTDNDFVDETSKMTVDELRAKLGEKGLDVDGSKEMLVSRLKASNKR